MIHKTIQLYEDKPEVTLSTYLLEDSREIFGGRKRPAILVCPGGGYLGCSDREAEPVALRFAAMGYHAFVLRYSTYFRTFPGNFDAEQMIPREESQHPAPVRDVAKAFLSIRENADDWLVDMNQVVLCGFSAGSHNAAMYSVYWDKPLITDFFEVDASELKPAGMILAYGISDYDLLFGRRSDDFGVQMRQASKLSVFGTSEPSVEQIREFSPVHHVSESTPPAFIWATSEDGLVPAENSLNMALALATAGVPYEIHIFEKGMHGLSLADRSTAGNRMLIETDAAKWIDLAESWLEKRVSMSIPDRPLWMKNDSGE